MWAGVGTAANVVAFISIVLLLGFIELTFTSATIYIVTNVSLLLLLQQQLFYVAAAADAIVDGYLPPYSAFDREKILVYTL